MAKESPCVRRKYGAVIPFDTSPVMAVGTNARVTSACNNSCIRDRAGVVNGASTDLGAEVHAEQAALINAHKRGLAFVLAGWQVTRDGYLEELKGVLAYPCLVCARMIRYAGYKWVHYMGSNGLNSIHVDDLVFYREQELGPHYE